MCQLELGKIGQLRVQPFTFFKTNETKSTTQDYKIIVTHPSDQSKLGAVKPARIIKSDIDATKVGLVDALSSLTKEVIACTNEYTNTNGQINQVQ